MGYHTNYIYSLLYHLVFSKFYRNVFYKRIGKVSYLLSWYLRKYIHFYPCANIVGGLKLYHPYCTYLNSQYIGENFTVKQCTTIGNKSDAKPEDLPIIGNNVTLGAHVCIIGKIKIGNNVYIGAGAVVVRDILDNCIVVGNPARIIKYESIQF